MRETTLIARSKAGTMLMRWKWLGGTLLVLAGCIGSSAPAAQPAMTSTTLGTPSRSTFPSTTLAPSAVATDQHTYASRFVGPALAKFDPSAARPGDVVKLVLPAPASAECGNLMPVFASGTGAEVRVLGQMRRADEPWEWITPAPNYVLACIPGPPSSETWAYRVPPLPAGRYLACMQNQATPDGCAWLDIVAA
jgi:hypothetical protein